MIYRAYLDKQQEMAERFIAKQEKGIKLDAYERQVITDHRAHKILRFAEPLLLIVPAERIIGGAVKAGLLPGTSLALGRRVPCGKPPVKPSGVWNEGPVVRGNIIEKELGQNLPQNFKTVDKFDVTTGKVTSIKSLNLDDKTYLQPQKLESVLRKYVDKVRDFKGDWHSYAKIEAREIKIRGLDVAVPHGGNTVQQDVFKRIIDYSNSNNVVFNLIVFP